MPKWTCRTWKLSVILKKSNIEWEREMFTKLFDKIDGLNSRYKELDSKFDDMIKSNNFVSRQYEDAKRKIQQIK